MTERFIRGKRYNSLSDSLKATFGGKCVKIPLDAGFTCPNIDGRCGTGGCIYCSARGSGDFAALPTVPLREQYEQGRALLAAKWPVNRCIPYFQAHTNTYAPVERLRGLYEEVLSYPCVVGLNIATRADCLPDETIALLDELSRRTHLTVELGLQTANDFSAKRMNRGHSYADFCTAVQRLRYGAPTVKIAVHLILGLPGEGVDEMMATARAVADLHPDEVKIHLLHVLRGTPLADLWATGNYCPLERDEYIDLVVGTLERLPPDTVIGRLTGDGAADDLLAPLWSRRKREVLNGIDKCLRERDTWQGRLYQRTVDN